MKHPSPNCDSREGQQVDMLVLHYTDMATAKEALERLCDPAAKVSAHYLVEEDGNVHALVAEEMRAWHAGVSAWRGNTNINQRSIGIEIANPGHRLGYRPFPKPQMEAVAALCKEILSRHDIPARNIVAHSDVAPTRKKDPGELFDWKWLAGLGVGLWPEEQYNNRISTLGIVGNTVQLMSWVLLDMPWYFISNIPLVKSLSKNHIAIRLIDSYDKIQTALAQYGYDCPQTGILDEMTKQVILAFQRHFFPARLTGVWDRECALRLDALLKMM